VNISKHRVKSFSVAIFANLCRYIFLIAFGFVLLYPFLYIIINSLKSPLDFLDPSVQWAPKQFSFENFNMAIKALDFWRSLGNTLFYQIGASLVQFLACMVAAYGLARFEFKGKRILMGIMILSIIVPVMMTIVPNYINFSKIDFLGILGLVSRLVGRDVRPNLIDTPWVFYLPAITGVGIKGGLFIYIFTQFFKGLPKELEEAAWIDGAGSWKTFLRIIIPSSGAAAITVLIFSIVWHWNDYYLAQMYLSDNQTLSVVLGSLNEDTIVNILGVGLDLARMNFVSIVFAACLLGIAPMIVFYLIIQRKFIASVANSGIVG